jgi:hypothetical protein
MAKPSEEELHQAMLNGIRDKGLSVLNWTPEAEQFRLRLQCAANWLPEYDWPAVDEDSLLKTLERWLLPHMSGVHSLRALKHSMWVRHCAVCWTGQCCNVWIVNCQRITLCQREAGLPFAIMRIILRIGRSDAGNVW